MYVIVGETAKRLREAGNIGHLFRDKREREAHPLLCELPKEYEKIQMVHKHLDILVDQQQLDW